MRLETQYAQAEPPDEYETTQHLDQSLLTLRRGPSEAVTGLVTMENVRLINVCCFMLLNWDNLPYWTESSHTHGLKSNCAIILLLKWFQLWPLEAPSNLPFLEVTRYSRLIFYFPSPSPIINHFSSELWFFLLENGVERLKSGHWACSLFLGRYCFQPLSVKRVCTPMCTYTLYTSVCVCVCVKSWVWGFLRGSVVKRPSANEGDARDLVSIPELGRSPGERNGNPLQGSCLENSMDRGAWWATVHGVANSRTGLSNWTHTHYCIWLASIFLRILTLGEALREFF